MDYKFYRVESFEVTGPYQLLISFDDGSLQTIDFTPVLAGEMYAPLRDLSFFNQVRLDREVHNLVWPNGADFNPAMLHDWNSNVAEIAASVANWESVRLICSGHGPAEIYSLFRLLHAQQNT